MRRPRKQSREAASERARPGARALSRHIESPLSASAPSKDDERAIAEIMAQVELEEGDDEPDDE
ncbi:MAG: hypothetical protein HY791_29250 [Deltaproteobacteria bacterium]|nr:hypothetical protein [Deltaproteobacteria bacterium]